MAPGMWGERMNDLTDEQADRLESALASFARGDGVARARLLAALAADVPPTVNSPRKARSERMKRYAFRSAAAPALVIALALGWPVSPPKSLFAQVAQAMSRARGFRCDFIEVTAGDNGAVNTTLAGRVFWTPNGDERLDFINDDKLESTRIYRPGKTGLLLEPAS